MIMAIIKRKDFQKVSSTVQEFLLKLPDEEASARLRDNLLQALHFLQLYYRLLQNRDKNTDSTQWTIDHSLSPLTPYRDTPDKFEWEWMSVESMPKLRQMSLTRSASESMRSLPHILVAIKNGNLTQVKQELNENRDTLYALDALNRDCVTYAIQYDQLDILKCLLTKSPNLNNPALDGSLSLHRAVYKRNAQYVKLLLEHGAPVNAQDFYLRTALHWSILNENLDCLRVLLDYGANVCARDQDGMTAATWACHLDHYEHLRQLVHVDASVYDESDNEGKSCIHWSVRKKEPLECLKALLNDETIYLVDKDGKTCLHTAAEQGALEACKIIIESVTHNNSNKNIINIRDSRKQTPLHVSSINGHARVIKLLIEYGADTNAKDATGATPLDYIVKRNLVFCNSIVDLCLRKDDRKVNKETNENTESFNSLTPAPPTTPKSVFSRNTNFFHASSPNVTNSLPPKPISRSTSIHKGSNETKSFQQEEHEMPTNGRNSRTSVNYRLTDRIPSALLKNSRASSRSSFASEDLDRYMNGVSQHSLRPVPQPRVHSNVSSVSGSNQKILSSRPKENESSVPPPIKPRVATQSSSSINGKQNEHTNNVSVENVSDGDESRSATSTKGEGFGSDFSDNELRRPRDTGPKTKPSKEYTSGKRPSTPMDIRPDQFTQPIQQLKKRQLSGGRQQQQQPALETQKAIRFNEWEPTRERQKSPSKVHLKDSSPRQTSGRNALNSASDRSQQELDLMISGKNIGRKDSSPQNTPREVAPLLRPTTRRLQPIDTNINAIDQQQQQQQQFEYGLNSPKQRADHFAKLKHHSKNSSSILDRKKLEPIRVQLNGSAKSNSNEPEHTNDFLSQSQNQFDDDQTQSISENTVSSERQRINTRNKVSAHNRSHFGSKKRLIEPMINDD